MLLRTHGMNPRLLIPAGTITVSAAILSRRFIRPGHVLSADKRRFS